MSWWIYSSQAEFISGNIKVSLKFFIIYKNWDGRGSKNTSLWMTWVYSSSLENTMTADDLEVQGAGASAASVQI